MGTRTAPRKKSKQRRRFQQARSLRQVPAGPAEFAEQSATLAGADPQDVSPAEFIEQAVAQPGQSAGPTSPIKQVAAAALILGQNVSKTATALGVDRRTIQRWRKFDPEFQQAMAETKQEVILSSRQFLLAAAEEAVAVVESKLEEEKDVQVALSLLRGIGALTPQALELSLDEEHRLENENVPEQAEQGSPPAAKFDAQSATLETPKIDSNDVSIEYQSPEFEALSAPQQAALQAFYQGKPLAEVALLAETTEATVRHWLCQDREFYNFLSGLQFDRIHRLKFRILALIKQAMLTVRATIQAGDQRVALSLIRGLGLMR